MKYTIFILSFILLTSCNQKEIKLSILPQETQIKGIDFANEVYMNYPLSIDYVKNNLLIFLHKNEHIIKVINAENGQEIRNIGTIGGGPREFVQPDNWGVYNDSIYIYDLGRKKLKIYNWDSIKNEPSLPIQEGYSFSNKEIDIFSGNIVNGKYFVTTVFYGMKHPITVWDKQLNVVDNTGTLPDDSHGSTTLVSYIGKISSYGNKFVYVMEALGYIACYSLQADGKCILEWEHFFEKPIYKKDQLDRKHLKLGFPDVKMTKNYIFCSYFGERLTREKLKTLKPRNILVFDHQGNLLKNLHSDRSIGTLTVSDDEKTLYTVTEEPEVAIIRFDLKTILK